MGYRQPSDRGDGQGYGPDFYGGTAGDDFNALICPHCDYETSTMEVGDFYCYDCELECKKEDIDDHLECDAMPMDSDDVLDELEFQLYQLHPEDCRDMREALENPKSRVSKQAKRVWGLWPSISGGVYDKKVRRQKEAETFDDLMGQTVSVECDRCGKSTEASAMSVNWAKSRGVNMKHLCNSCSQDAYIDAEKHGLINRAESVYDYVTQKDRTCAWCGGTPNFMVYDLPTGPHAFCTELHFTRFVGLDERPSGYYGFEAENFSEKTSTITNKEIKLLAIGIIATILGTFFSEVLIDRYREDPELVDNGEQNA